MTAKTAAERKADERKRMRRLGYVLRQAWVHPGDWPAIKKRIEEARAKRVA